MVKFFQVYEKISLPLFLIQSFLLRCVAKWNVKRRNLYVFLHSLQFKSLLFPDIWNPRQNLANKTDLASSSKANVICNMAGKNLAVLHCCSFQRASWMQFSKITHLEEGSIYFTNKANKWVNMYSESTEIVDYRIRKYLKFTVDDLS